jgi:hypothetical protein
VRGRETTIKEMEEKIYEKPQQTNANGRGTYLSLAQTSQ